MANRITNTQIRAIVDAVDRMQHATEAEFYAHAWQAIADAVNRGLPEGGQCKDCDWWSVWDQQEHGSWGQCGMAESQDGEPVQELPRAIARDHEGYAAWLDTAPDFGCVQWVARDD